MPGGKRPGFFLNNDRHLRSFPGSVTILPYNATTKDKERT